MTVDNAKEVDAEHVAIVSVRRTSLDFVNGEQIEVEAENNDLSVHLGGMQKMHPASMKHACELP